MANPSGASNFTHLLCRCSSIENWENGWGPHRLEQSFSMFFCSPDAEGCSEFSQRLLMPSPHQLFISVEHCWGADRQIYGSFWMWNVEVEKCLKTHVIHETLDDWWCQIQQIEEGNPSWFETCTTQHSNIKQSLNHNLVNWSPATIYISNVWDTTFPFANFVHTFPRRVQLPAILGPQQLMYWRSSAKLHQREYGWMWKIVRQIDYQQYQWIWQQMPSVMVCQWFASRRSKAIPWFLCCSCWQSNC